ncbi:MAG TPA: DUF4388 domain-containing protein [Thermodesulfovibrionales bacterium]|nr:DUF4388 domain-containing protein [Thermodesulfovibrionales bacterium]
MSLVGRLEDLALADILQILSIGKKTGTLTIRGDGENSFIVFKNGLIVRAETSMLERSMGHDLVRHGIVKEHVLKTATELKRKLPTKSIAEILYELNSVSREQMERAGKKRIEKVISRLVTISSGDFRFELDSLDPGSYGEIDDTGWEISKGLSAQYLLMEGARIHDEQAVGQSEKEDLSGEESDEGWGEDEQSTAAERRDIFALKSLTQELRFPNSMSEITLLILRFASDVFERGVLFLVGDYELTGLGQFGLEIDGADEKIREIVIPYEDSPFLKGLVAAGRPYEGPMGEDRFTEFLLREIGEKRPSKVAFFPVIAENRVVALLYCDNSLTGADFCRAEGLEIFIDQAGLALEKTLLEKRLQEIQRRTGSS